MSKILVIKFDKKICQNLNGNIIANRTIVLFCIGFMSYVWKHVIKNYWCRNIYWKSKVSVQSGPDFRKAENCSLLLDLCYGCWKKIDYKLCFTSRWSGSIVFLDKNRSICFFLFHMILTQHCSCHVISFWLITKLTCFLKLCKWTLLKQIVISTWRVHFKTIRSHI